jgi:hypothetical protein
MASSPPFPYVANKEINGRFGSKADTRHSDYRGIRVAAFGQLRTIELAIETRTSYLADSNASIAASKSSTSPRKFGSCALSTEK